MRWAARRPPAASEQPRLRSMVRRRLLRALSKAGRPAGRAVAALPSPRATVTEQHHRRAAPLGRPPPRGAHACRRAELLARRRSRPGSRVGLLGGAAPRH
jgi:hypothetical protein